MTWAARRRIIIVLILLVVIGGLTLWHYAPVIWKAPLCTDGAQNGTETGIDCGGSCTNLCTFEVKNPTVLWQRSFPVTDSVYNAVAYVENKNDAAVRSIGYEFRLYDDKGVYVNRVDGTALIPPLGRYAIIETGIQVGHSVIKRTTFDFSSAPVTWLRIPATVEKLRVSTSDIALDTSGDIPRLTAMIKNPATTATLNNVTVAAILYDADNNAVNASKTFIETLAPGAGKSVAFTWPNKLSAPIVRYELLPIIDVFNTK